MAGLSSALHLAELGAGSVQVLEANGIGSGSSGLSVGIVETQYVEPLDIELRVRSMEFLAELEEEFGLEIVRNGYLRLCRSSEDLSAFQRSVEMQRSLGVPDARVLEPAGIHRIVPDLDLRGVIAGLFGPSDGYLDGHRYCSLLADRARAAGARIHRNRRAVGLDRGTNGSLRIRTVDGALDCDFVVNAAGAWASRVGDALAAPVRVAPQRHQAAYVQLPEALPYVMPSVMDYTPHSGGFGLYFRHDGPGRLIAGLHTEEIVEGIADPDRYSRQADQPFLATVAEKLQRSLPTLADAGLAGGWAGLYPVSVDGYPLVGPHPGNDRVIVACGLGGSGIQLSPVVGRLVAEWIVYGETRTVTGTLALLPGRFLD